MIPPTSEPSKATRVELQAPGLTLRARRWAMGPRPALLLHGMAGNAHWWDAAAPRLAGLDAAALDFRGHGESDWQPDGVYTVDGFVSDIEAARAAFGWDRFTLIGHSMGARAALDYAFRHPERLDALVAIDFLPAYRVRKNSRFGLRMRRRLAQPTYAEPDGMIERFHLEPDGTTLGPDALRALARTCVKPVGERWTWRFDWRAFALTYGAAWPDLTKIAVPTLIVRGTESLVMTAPDYAQVLAEIPGARGVEIQGSHHHVPLDAPGPLAEATLAFLEGR